MMFFFFSSRRRHTRFDCDWSSDVCSSDLPEAKREFQKNVLPLIASLRELERAHWVRELSAILNIKEEAIWDALIRIKTHVPVQKSEGLRNRERDRKTLLEGKILSIVTQFPALQSKLEPMFLYVTQHEN